jgi:hypothetical protein
MTANFSCRKYIDTKTEKATNELFSANSDELVSIIKIYNCEPYCVSEFDQCIELLKYAYTFLIFTKRIPEFGKQIPNT